MRPLLALAALLAPPALADDQWALAHALERWEAHCQETAPTEAEMQACFEGGVAEIDAELDATLARWLTSTEDDLPAHRAEHEALIRESYQTRHRLAELECADETFASRTGSGYGTIYAHCLLGKRIEHLAYLTRLAQYY